MSARRPMQRLPFFVEETLISVRPL